MASCLLFILGLGGYLLPSKDEPLPQRILMENEGGRVIFTHNDHSSKESYLASDCSVCHHELNMPGFEKAHELFPAKFSVSENTPFVLSCASCHRKADQEDFIESHQELYMSVAGDSSCASCHHASFDGFAQGWNHEEHIDITAGYCESCHHPENYEYAEGQTITVEKQKCSNCHSASPKEPTTTTLEVALHERCGTCHSDWIEDGIKGCKSCHNIIPNTGKASFEVVGNPNCTSCHKNILPSMDAFHAQCMTCHDTVGRGPGAEAACAQCHRK